jgi:hypothetical protein
MDMRKIRWTFIRLFTIAKIPSHPLTERFYIATKIGSDRSHNLNFELRTLNGELGMENWEWI